MSLTPIPSNHLTSLSTFQTSISAPQLMRPMLNPEERVELVQIIKEKVLSKLSNTIAGMQEQKKAFEEELLKLRLNLHQIEHEEKERLNALDIALEATHRSISTTKFKDVTEKLKAYQASVQRMLQLEDLQKQVLDQNKQSISSVESKSVVLEKDIEKKRKEKEINETALTHFSLMQEQNLTPEYQDIVAASLKVTHDEYNREYLEKNQEHIAFCDKNVQELKNVKNNFLVVTYKINFFEFQKKFSQATPNTDLKQFQAEYKALESQNKAVREMGPIENHHQTFEELMQEKSNLENQISKLENENKIEAYKIKLIPKKLAILGKTLTLLNHPIVAQAMTEPVSKSLSQPLPDVQKEQLSPIPSGKRKAIQALPKSRSAKSARIESETRSLASLIAQSSDTNHTTIPSSITEQTSPLDKMEAWFINPSLQTILSDLQEDQSENDLHKLCLKDNLTSPELIQGIRTYPQQLNTLVKGWAPLHLLIKRGNISILKDLIYNSTQLNLKIQTSPEQWNSVQLMAAQHLFNNAQESDNFQKSYRKFYESGLCASEPKACSPIHIAAKFCNEVTFNFFAKRLSKDNKILSLTDESGNAPIHYAASKPEGLPIVQTILSREGDPNITNGEGRSPLALAILSASLEMVKAITRAPGFQFELTPRGFLKDLEFAIRQRKKCEDGRGPADQKNILREIVIYLREEGKKQKQ